MRLPSVGTFIVVLAAIAAVSGGFDPYRTLGVGRRATTKEIRKEYKRLAKEWHPDKNKSPEAETKFIEISKAYELLSDSERRRMYDDHGVTEENQQQGFGGGGGGGFGGFHQRRGGGGGFDPFESFFDGFFDGPFGHGGGRQQREEKRKSALYKNNINAHEYFSRILGETERQPYLIMFHSDWCFMCMRVEPIWARLVEELEPVGFGIATVHTGRERELAHKLGTRELPHMVLVVDKKVNHYRDPQFSAIKALEFVRSKFPSNLVERIDDSNIDNFLRGWMDNRIRVLLFANVEVTRLRYLTTAFKYRSRAAVGYVRLSDRGAQKTIRRFAVPKSSQIDTMFVFHEKNPGDHDHVPVASLSMKDLGVNAMAEVIDANLFLQLPRLSSQSVFDALCPAESSRHQKRLCVTLVTKEAEAQEHERHRQALRDFAMEHMFSPDRVRFTYVLMEKQADFVQSLSAAKPGAKGGKEKTASEDLSDPSLKIAILWRRGNTKLKFEWLEGTWTQAPEDQANHSREELERTINRLLSSNEVLLHETVIKELFDEHAQSIFVRIMNRVVEGCENLRDTLTREELFPAISLILTVGAIMFGGYLLNYLAGVEESNLERGFGVDGKRIPELKVHEMKAESYNGLVRLLRPGCRTIVVLVDRDSKEQLVRRFFRTAWPYRRNKSLLFAFVYIERARRWYEQILQVALHGNDPDAPAIRVNPKNCVGTVLALNGHRRYFCMYHARHPERAGSSVDEETELRQRRFDDTFSEVTMAEESLLDGLPIWLDRLFEGTTRRYHVDFWPDMPVLSQADAEKLAKKD